MTTFDNREQAFENKFAHDAEMQFKARARRNRLFGEWLAGELGLSGEDVADYAASIVKADLEEEGDADIMRKVNADLAAHNMTISEDKLETQLAEFLVVAKEQLAASS